VDLVGVLDLERHEQADYLKRVRSSVDVVAEEDVVIRSDVTAVCVVNGTLPNIEESHQVRVLPVEVPENFARRLYF